MMTGSANTGNDNGVLLDQLRTHYKLQHEMGDDEGETGDFYTDQVLHGGLNGVTLLLRRLVCSCCFWIGLD